MYITMDTRILEKLAVDEENIEWGRRIINKSDINAVSVVKASAYHTMRSDKLAMTMGVTDINQIAILNEIMNPFMIEEGETYLAPDSNVDKYYEHTEPHYPTTKSSVKAASKRGVSYSAAETSNNAISKQDTSKLTPAEITEILEPKTDRDRQNRLKYK